MSEANGPFAKALRKHDWFYQYSDSHSEWKKGQDSSDRLQTMRTELQCPYNMTELCQYALGNILEQFEELEPGKYWRRDSKYKEHTAPVLRDELMTQECANAITAWLVQYDTER